MTNMTKEVKWLCLASAGAFLFWVDDQWRYTQLVGIMALSWPLVMAISRDYYPWAAVAFAMSLGSGMLNLHVPTREFGPLAQNISAASGRAVVLLLVFGFLSVYKKLRGQQLGRVIATIGLANATYILIRGVLFHQGYGMLNSSSFDTAMIAACYPAIALRPVLSPGYLKTWRDIRPLLILELVVPLVAIYMVGESTAWGTLGAALIAYYFCQRKYVLSGIAFASGLIIAILHQGQKAFDSMGRTGLWQILIDYMQKNDMRQNYGWGSGAGEWVIPVIQRAYGNPTSIFIWAHNEWIQVALEQGVVVLFCLLLLVGWAIGRSYRVPWLFATVAAILVNMTTQMPFRYMPFQIIVLCVLILVRDIDGGDTEQAETDPG